MVILDLDPHLSCIQTLVLCTDSVVVCLFMCSYTDTSDTYWPGAMYQALCWPLRRWQGAEQA